MIKIHHRINTIEDLKNTPKSEGVEFDIRSEGKSLILHHDAFQKGVEFETYLKNYRHRMMIINTKAVGLTQKIMGYLQKYQIQNYFFLDLSVPEIVELSHRGIKDIAVRFSEYEPIEFAQKFKDKVKWVWVDCFDKFVLDKLHHQILKNHFKICLVSPELQGQDKNKIYDFKYELGGRPIDAVCTKFPEIW